MEVTRITIHMTASMFFHELRPSQTQNAESSRPERVADTQSGSEGVCVSQKCAATWFLQLSGRMAERGGREHVDAKHMANVLRHTSSVALH